MSSPITERLAGLLERTDPFDTLTDAQRLDLIGDMTLEIYEPGEVILEQGTDVHRALYIVESGLVRLMDVESNKLVDMAGEGAQFGSYGLMQGGILPYEARAVDKTVCTLLASGHFKALVKREPSFKAHYEEEVKKYVRTLDAEIDASGAFLLFDTRLSELIHRVPVSRTADTSVKDVASAMVDAGTDTVLVVQNELPIGLVTEGDLVKRVLAEGRSPDTPVGELITRPPIALTGNERLFDAMSVMMRHRVRRVVVVEADGQGKVLGLVSSQDIGHFRGLDPVATTERIEKSESIAEIKALRTESNRRLYRLYQQGVHAEDLLGVISELDDQMKKRLLHIVEESVKADESAPTFDGPWAWLTFGAAGRRESAVYAEQFNGIVYADPANEEEGEKARAFFERFAAEAGEAFKQVGYPSATDGITATRDAFRQPLSQWIAAFDRWIEGVDAAATNRAAPCFDMRAIYGDEDLGEQIRRTLKDHLPSDRLTKILIRQGTEKTPPISFFGTFETDRAEGQQEGLDLRKRGLKPIVDLARALAMEASYLRSTSTADRLRYVADNNPAVARDAQELLAAFRQLADLHLRFQMQRAEVGEAPGDRVDPANMHKSQQNLLKETFKQIQKAQSSIAKRYKVD